MTKDTVTVQIYAIKLLNMCKLQQKYKTTNKLGTALHNLDICSKQDILSEHNAWVLQKNPYPVCCDEKQFVTQTFNKLICNF